MNNLEFRYFDPLGKFFVYSSEFDWPDNFSKLEKFFSMASRYSEGIVQQFTGLIDSEGKKIFEGDILTFRPRSNKPPFWEVIFDTGLAMYCLFNRKKETFFEYEDFIRGHICGLDTRIIGNIFETPELLK
jgi:hypothetical protein